MNIMAIIGLLPTILKAVDLARQIGRDVDADKSVGGIIGTIQQRAPAVLEIFQKVGSELFPNLDQQQQVAAATVVFDAATVKKIQTRLNDLKVSAAPLDVDGHYGPKTKEAVRNYQQANGLVVDGWAGKNTQAKLFGA